MRQLSPMPSPSCTPIVFVATMSASGRCSCLGSCPSFERTKSHNHLERQRTQVKKWDVEGSFGLPLDNKVYPSGASANPDHRRGWWGSAREGGGRIVRPMQVLRLRRPAGRPAALRMTCLMRWPACEERSTRAANIPTLAALEWGTRHPAQDDMRGGAIWRRFARRRAGSGS
jgi:hypothetical protein